jgi:glycosyltransferase involved in cell wall biosynthesis
VSSIIYVCLQPRIGWGASQTHVDGVVNAWRRAGCEVLVLDLGGDYVLLRRAAVAVALQLRLLARLRRTDFVYVRMHPLAILSVAAARATRRPVVVEVNGVSGDMTKAHPMLRPVSRVVERLLRAVVRLADDVVVVTPGLGDWARRVRRDGRVHHVPNAADVECFRPGLGRPADVPDAYVLFFGALAAWQGISTALEATQHPRWPAVPLVVLGDGELGPQVAAAAAAHPDRVRWLGSRHTDEVPAYVGNALVTLALKNYHDVHAGQSPLKLYESMAAGVPVIASSLPGLREPVQEAGCGVVLPVVSPEAVAAAVQTLIEQPDLRHELGRNGRAAAVRQHSWDDRARRLLALLPAERSAWSRRPHTRRPGEA